MTAAPFTGSTSVDSAGFVTVDGQRVLSVPGKPLRYAEATLLTCQRCHRADCAPYPAVLWRSWEESVGRYGYWYGHCEGASLVWFCDACRGVA